MDQKSSRSLSFTLVSSVLRLDPDQLSTERIPLPIKQHVWKLLTRRHRFTPLRNQLHVRAWAIPNFPEEKEEARVVSIDMAGSREADEVFHDAGSGGVGGGVN